MTEGSGEGLQLRTPSSWDGYEGSHYKWDQIEMKELVYSDLESGTAEAIRDWIEIPGCSPQNLERVHRLDGQTIEVVWYDDVEDCDEDEEPTKVPGRVIRSVRERVQEMFGEQWRVERKPDERRVRDQHPQRALIRRADRQRFTYVGESQGEYQIALNGRPPNAPEEIIQYTELERYPTPPTADEGTERDIYLYDSGTGTKHLIDGHFQLRMEYVACDVDTHCTVSVDAEDVVDGERIEHYAEYLKGQREQHIMWQTDPDPKTTLGDDLCTRCWQSYAMTRKSVRDRVIGYDAPLSDYRKLLEWTPEEEDEDHD